jgi:hypothetical protein
MGTTRKVFRILRSEVTRQRLGNDNYILLGSSVPDGEGAAEDEGAYSRAGLSVRGEEICGGLTYYSEH